MASNIDATKPVTGNPTTQSVRDNFSAAKTEIEALQTDKLGDAPSDGSQYARKDGAWEVISTLINVTFSDIDSGAYLTSAEAFSDVDTQLMTAAAINDLIESKSYLTSVALNDLSDVSTAGATSGQVLTYNGVSYDFQDASGGATVTVGDATPSSPSVGDMWFDSNDTTLNVYYDDGTSTQWVAATGSAGPAGTDGTNGIDGNDGAAATIAVGTVTTGTAGSNATITNSGTSNAATFDFTIPRGDTGAPGTDGTDGIDGAAATIAVGTVTTGAAGSSVIVTNSGTSSAATFDFTIPRGDTGAAGADGIQLTALSVTTNAAGTAALSYNNTNGVFSYTPPDLSGYLTSYTETDTLDSVTGRGATTTNDISVGDITADQSLTLANGAKVTISTTNSAFTDFLGGSTNNTSDDGLFAFYGGRAYNQGAGVVLYGDDHATLPNVISFKNGAFVERFAINADGTASFKNGVQENQNAVTSSAGALTINCTNGNVFSLALSENVTSTTFSNPPATGTAFGFSLFVTQDATARTITWPASVAWPSATAPTLSGTSGDVDVFTFTTFDGGTTWYGIVSGQAL